MYAVCPPPSPFLPRPPPLSSPVSCCTTSSKETAEQLVGPLCLGAGRGGRREAFAKFVGGIDSDCHNSVYFRATPQFFFRRALAQHTKCMVAFGVFPGDLVLIMGFSRLLQPFVLFCARSKFSLFMLARSSGGCQAPARG